MFWVRIMKNRNKRGFALIELMIVVIVMGILAVSAISKTMKPTVIIDVTKTGEPISKYIYGQFIEHLGRCIYGGIWAEMLEDRKFYYPVKADYSPWRVIKPPNNRWSGAGVPYKVLGASPWQIIGPDDALRMVKEDSYVGEHTPEVRATGDGKPCGIAQNELVLTDGREYVGRVLIAAEPDVLPIEVSLVWGKGKDDRDTVIINTAGQTGQFKKYPLRFKAGATTEKGRLEIISHGKGVFRIGTASLMPGDNLNGWRADTLRLMKELNSPIYRWPGGNFVSGYNWKDGIGDRDKRPPRKNPAWKGIEHNDVGIHEFIDLCQKLDAEPYIAVNTGLGSVESARQEVEYVNSNAHTPMGKLRAENGHLKPFNVKWWAVGNEMFGSWQLGNVPLEQYVKRHNQFAEAMRSVDPSIQLIGVGAVGRWSEQMLTHCSDYIELISEHFYSGEKDDILKHVAQIPHSVKLIAYWHRNLRKRIKSLAGKDIRIAVDEWNYWYGPYIYGELGVRYYMKDALGIAAGLHEFFRNTDIIFMANYAQTVNVIGCIKTNKISAEFAATGQVLKLYRNRFGQIPVEVSGTPEPLDVAAAWIEDGKALTIAIVNPTRVKYSLNVNLKGAAISRNGLCWMITSDSDEMAYNEPGKAARVQITEKAINVISNELEAPPISVSLYRLPVK